MDVEKNIMNEEYSAHMELKLGACEVKHRCKTEKFSFEKQKRCVYMKCYFCELRENILLQVRFLNKRCGVRVISFAKIYRIAYSPRRKTRSKNFN